MRAIVILVAVIFAAVSFAACGAAEPRAQPTYTQQGQPTEVEMVLHVPCVTPPCGASAEAAPEPVMVGRPPPAMLALGWDHSCALVADGGVWCWGGNSHDQMGDIGGDQAPIPTRVPSIPPMGALWAGANQTCGRARDDGQLWCWGETGLGPTREPVFAQSLPFPNVRMVSLAYRKGCFITADGALYCWGDYGAPHGPRWDGPRRVPLEGVSGLRGGMSRSCALTARGITCWGLTPAYTFIERTEAPFFRLPDLRDVALFAFDDFAPHPPMWIVDRRGRVHEATPTGRPDARHSGHRHLALRELPNLASVVELGSSGNHQCARTSGGTAACWGFNSSGQVGDGTTATRQEPHTLALTGVEEIAVGKSHTCARAQGRLFCWGDNGSGQIGIRGPHDVLAPVEVPW